MEGHHVPGQLFEDQPLGLRLESLRKFYARLYLSSGLRHLRMAKVWRYL